MEFGHMVYKILIPLCGLKGFWKLNNHGCWCGPGTPVLKNYEPMDAYDDICRFHDLCYTQYRHFCQTNYTIDVFNRYSRLGHIQGYYWQFNKESKQVIK